MMNRKFVGNVVKVWLVVMGLAAVVAPASTTAVFQNGSNGYQAAQDTYLSGAWDAVYGDVNYGGSEAFSVGAISWVSGDKPRFVGLLQFNELFGGGANQVPEHATILNATLRLTAFNRSDAGGESIAIHPMLTDWVEGNSDGVVQEDTSCFFARKYRTDGDYVNHPQDAWGTSGQISNGPDFYTDVLNSESAWCRIGGSGSGSYMMDFPVSEIVTEWQNGAITNNGFYLRTNSYWSSVDFWSSQGAVTANRPQLIVEYVPEPASLVLLVLGGLLMRRKSA